MLPEIPARTSPSFDNGGNILSKTEYAYTLDTVPVNPVSTITYTYDSLWKDKLTSYNGKQVVTDEIGNTLSYDGWSFTWQKGRELVDMSGNGKAITYSYNENGIRTQKTVNGVTTSYHLIGDLVTFESNGTDSIHYTYGLDNALVSMNLNGVEYYYVRNGQGDITGLIDSTGTQVVSYTYDVWGKLVATSGTLASTVGEKNPYRYRGYRYDAETGFYYLQSRYYSPDWGRFINADETNVIYNSKNTLSIINLFSYCEGNPITRYDYTGKNWASTWSQNAGYLPSADGPYPVGDIIFLAGLFISFAADAYTSIKITLVLAKVSKGNSKYKGKAGEIKKEGTDEIKIGKDGKAVKVRHHSTHGNPKYHTNPHDHNITWNGETPSFSKPINYPNGAPSFK